MKNLENSYANVRVGYYESRFLNRTNQQLVDEFNQLANSRGWTAERLFFSVALMNEMIRREMDVSAISKCNDRGQVLSVRYVVVRYDGASKSLVPLIDVV